MTALLMKSFARRRHHRPCLLLLVAGLTFSHEMDTVEAADPAGIAARKDAWRKKLNGIQYRIPTHYSGLVTSLGRFSADVKVHVIFDPKNKWTIEFKFVRIGREVLSLRGHDQSAFASFENTLYFAKYPPDSTGCRILAYDLTSGEKLWETELHQSKPLGHSLYRNLVSVRVSGAEEAKGEIVGAAVVVTGMESYCDYVEVLDRQTGALLAVKNYRVGFGPPPSPGGGFGGKENDNE